MLSNRTLFKSCMAAILLVSVALLPQPSVSAPPGPDGNRGHLNRLLHDQAVIEYLGLTDQQAQSAQAVSNDVLEKHRAAFDKALSPATKAERVPLVKQVFISVNKDTFDGLASVMNASQYERLQQIEMQTFGIRAFDRPTVVEYLKLTPTQRKDLNALARSMGEKLSGIHRSSDLSAEDKKAAAGKIRRDGLHQARQFIGPDQWVKWELLIGAEFQQ